MAKDDIPVKESTFSGVPFDGSVRGAQEALQGIMSNPEKETATEDLEQTVATEEAPVQDMESESVQTEVENPDGLTAEDLVDDTQEEEIETTNTYTMKVDGEQVEVTLDELQAGYRRQADYQRNSQVLAEQQKQANEELATAQQERQRYISQLEQFKNQGKSQLDAYNNIDWTKLKEEDPMEYMAKRDAYRDLQENIRASQEEQQKEQSKFQQQQMKNFEEQKKVNYEDLIIRVPQWADPEKGIEVKQNVKQYAQRKGFTTNELDSLIDSRSIEMLYKAMLYDNLLNSKINSKKQKIVPKVTKPGTGTSKGEASSDKYKAQKAKLKKSGSVRDAANALDSLLNS
tara:strand:+ start:974 stop:2005 length:1032 start_codon:yes stop_codon:yes gene_type:complete